MSIYETIMKLVTMEKSNVDIVRLGGERGERGGTGLIARGWWG